MNKSKKHQTLKSKLIQFYNCEVRLFNAILGIK